MTSEKAFYDFEMALPFINGFNVFDDVKF